MNGCEHSWERAQKSPDRGLTGPGPTSDPRQSAPVFGRGNPGPRDRPQMPGQHTARGLGPPSPDSRGPHLPVTLQGGPAPSCSAVVTGVSPTPVLALAGCLGFSGQGVKKEGVCKPHL